MRILILANSHVGLYKFRKELLEKLVEDNEVFASLPNGEYVKNIKEIGCHYIETEMERKGKNPFADLELMKKYMSILDEVKPDVVLTYTIKPNVYGGMACQRKGVPYIVNVTGLGTAVENGGILQKITVTLYKIGLRKASMVFFQNEANRDFMLSRNMVKGPYSLIPGSGVNASQYTVTEYPEDKKIRFVYVGRMMKEKGFELYLDAAEAIKKNHPNTEFCICGAYEGNYRERVDRLISEGVVYFYGLVKDMAAVYSTVHCLVHPTYYPEGLSNVLLESLACGRPIITTDRPGCREVVEDGVNGFVVKQKDRDDLIEKIEKFLSLNNEERKEMGLIGRSKVEKEFARSIVINRYLEEIEKVKNGK